MKKLSEPIIFFGSGPVAAQSLSSLLENFAVSAVITKSTPAHHHGSVPVLELAKKKDLKIYSVQNKTELIDLFKMDDISITRIAVLVDFGMIIPAAVISHFPLGIVNSHFSMLPKWRGADPITFTILGGEKETGISLMLIVKKMDEGPIIAQTPYTLPPTITTPELTDELVELSNSTLKAILPLYMHGQASARPQDSSIKPTYSRKLTKEDGYIEWRKPARQIEREIRAFAGWPKSHTTIKNTPVIITQAHVVDIALAPGSIRNIEKELVIGCGQQALAIDKLKPSGKKEIRGSDFLLGYQI